MAPEPDHTGAAAKKAGHGLTKKLGPLPVWAWGALVGVVVLYFVYARDSSSSASTSSASGLTDADAGTANTLDASSIDPNTGLTYAEEEAAAENADAADNSDALGGGGTSDSGLGTSDGTDGIADATNLIGELGGLFQAFQAADPYANGTVTAATATPVTPAGTPAPSVATTSGTSPTVTASTTTTPAQAAAGIPQPAVVKAASKVLATGNDGVSGGSLKPAENLNKVTTPKIPQVKQPAKTVTKTKK